MRVRRRTGSTGKLSAAAADPGMGYWNLRGVWVSEYDETTGCETYFWTFWPESRTSKRFTPPNLRDFLLELLDELPDDPAAQAAQERQERVRIRAISVEEALDTGSSRPCPPLRSDPLE